MIPASPQHPTPTSMEVCFSLGLSWCQCSLPSLKPCSANHVSCHICKATAEYLTLFEVMAALDLKQTIALNVYMLTDAQRPVANIKPEDVFVKAIPQEYLQHDGKDVCFWPLAKKQAKPRRAKPKPPSASSSSADPIAGMQADAEPELPPCSDDDPQDEENQEQPHHDELAEVLANFNDDDDFDEEAEVENEMPMPDVASHDDDDTILPPAIPELPVPEPPAAAEPDTAAEPAIPPRPPPKRGARGRAELEVICPNGAIKYYISTGDFVSTCLRPGHGSKCRLTRTSRPNARRVAQGRPLGLLFAWLQLPATDQQSHLHLRPSLEERVAGRAALTALPSGDSLQDLERDLRMGEGAEPADCP